MNKQCITLMGPTASGKTALALKLCDELPLQIVSVDSALVYKGMDIGTAKPEASVLASYPHDLIDIKSIQDIYSVAEFCQDAHNASQRIWNENKTPFWVGGTMMYFKSFQSGLSELPQADTTLRKQFDVLLKIHGLDYLYQQLVAFDPKTAHRLHPNDTQRILRALEVCYVAQKPYSDQLEQKSSIQVNHPKYQWVQMALFPKNRSWLHERIEQRFETMMAQGFLKEVANILQCNGPDIIDSPAMRSVGYRQAIAYLQGQYDFDTFKAKALAATRQLAKRQLTWLRSWPEVHYFDPENPDCFKQMLELILMMLDNKHRS